jgi:hypothetical protein
MALPFLSPSRTVLLIGDEALSVYKVTSGAARLVDTVPWQASDFDDRVVRLVRHDCGNKPVLIVNDMTDQHFKGGQRMPRVNVMDKQNVLNRKLQVAFPNYPIRGALQIKQNRKDSQAVRDPSGQANTPVRGGGMYLFAAVPLSEPITKTIEAVKQSMASIAGIVLLPVEAADMVASLSAKLGGKERKPARWCIFVGQHRGGALRQVITRDGQLAMTRMTPVVDHDANPAQWAVDVAQELKATISYLSRFGYTADDGTDVIVISGPEAGDTLKEMIDITCNYTAFTVNEAARLVGASIGLQEDQSYADPLLAAWIGRKNKFSLPMRAQELSDVSRPRQYAAAAMFLLLLGVGWLSYQLLTQFQDLSDIKTQLTDQNQALTKAKTAEDAEIQRMQALGFDIKLIQASIKTYGDMQASAMDPLAAVHKIGMALGGELRLTELKIQMVDPGGSSIPGMSYQALAPAAPAKDANGTPLPSAKDMLAIMTLNFPSTMDPAVGVKQVNALQGRLKAQFPGYAVDITRQVANLGYTEDTSGKIGGDGTANNQDYVAEIQVRGHSHD